jgi:site-specific DNA-methyltransferase (adenine-specific)
MAQRMAGINMNFTIETCDAIEYLTKFAAESVDLVVADPAYQSLEKHRAKGTTTRLKASDASSNEWFPIFPNERFFELFVELHRVLKKGTHCYVLCDQGTMFLVHDVAQKAGFTWHKFLVWDKVRPGMGYHYRATHEVICFLEKGKRSGDGRGSLNDNSTADVLRFEEVADVGAILSHERVNPKGAYPTEKPVSLLSELIRMSSRPGDFVVDPFGGSFSTGVAASLLGRRFGGCDVKQSAVDAGRRRLSETPFLAR